MGLGSTRIENQSDGTTSTMAKYKWYRGKVSTKRLFVHKSSFPHS